MDKNIRAFLAMAMLLVASSCASTKKIVYFQDSSAGDSKEMAPSKGVVAQPSDQISVIVSSKDPELASVFNLPIISHQTGSTQPGFSTTAQNQVAAYTVDSAGNIDFPLLGTLHVAGLARDEIAVLIKSTIVARNLIRDPVVIVEFSNMYVSVFGDISMPGRVRIDKDRMTVLDALAKAGDLNVTGVRKVKVFREEGGYQRCYELDLTKAEGLFSSPVYYVRQEDIIYVEPNKMKARSSTVNGNTLVSTSFWIAVGSLATSIAALVVNVLK